jgi:hypothetical protein
MRTCYGDGVAFELTGPPRRPRQLLATQTYGGHHSIHNDETARQLGFDGATIEGPTHLSQFAPLGELAWGGRWWEAPCLSLHFSSPAYEGEPLRASIELAAIGAGAGRAEIRKHDGTVVASGTAGVDAGQDTEVRARLARTTPPEEPTLVTDMQVGDRYPAEVVRIDADAEIGPMYPFSLADKLAVITEPHPWYNGDDTPWGRPVLPLEMVNVLTYYSSSDVLSLPQAIGLFVDLEVRLLGGPLFVGEAYRINREVVGLGSSRRTESFWVSTTVHPFGGGPALAETLLHTALLKDSIPPTAAKESTWS